MTPLDEDTETLMLVAAHLCVSIEARVDRKFTATGSKESIAVLDLVLAMLSSLALSATEPAVNRAVALYRLFAFSELTDLFELYENGLFRNITDIDAIMGALDGMR